MTLSIIIVSYNVKSYLRQCLKSVYQSSSIGSFEVIIVDNYSHDKSCEMIENEFPEVKLIKIGENLGFSKAVNIGFKESSGSHFCLLNPDTLISEDTLCILLDYLNGNPEIGCIGPKILDSDGSLQLSCKRSFPTPMVALPKLLGLSRLFPKNRILGKYNLTYLNPDKIHKVDAISGSFMLFKREIVDKIGNFDESFFMFGEDLDFCYRINKIGKIIIYNPHTQVIHYKGESIKSAPYDMINIFYSSIDRFFNKHKEDYPAWRIIHFLVKIGISLRKIISYLQSYIPQFTSQAFDTSYILASFILAISLWYPYHYGDFIPVNNYIQHWPLVMDYICCWILCSYFIHLYKKHYLSYGRSIAVSISTFLLAATTTYFISTIAYSRGVLLLTGIFTTLSTAGWRVSIHLLYRYRKVKLTNRTPLFSRRAVILGSDTESQRIGNLLRHTPESHFIFLGFIDRENKTLSNDFLGRIEDIKGIIENQHINELIIPEKYYSIRNLIKLLDHLRGMNVNYKLVPQGEKMLIGKGLVENLSGVNLVDFDLPLFDRIHLFNKRIFDFLISSLLLILTAPLHLYFLISKKYSLKNIWAEGPNNITLLEYKSKYPIIRESAYLFNILIGSISFVGSQIIDFENNDPKLLVKPGLTGLAHLKSRSINLDSNRPFEQYYALNHSMMFDIEIILKSIFKI